MEVRVRERLIGALVLVAIVVLIVPAILKGRDAAPAAVFGACADSTSRSADRRLNARSRRSGPGAGARTARCEAGCRAGARCPTRTRQARPQNPGVRRRRRRRCRNPRVRPRDPPAKSQTAPAPAATTSAWAVQLGAFSNQSKAEQLVAELRKRRYAAFILEYRAGGQVLYRVRVGPEQDRARAVETAARLEKDGFQPVVARHP